MTSAIVAKKKQKQNRKALQSKNLVALLRVFASLLIMSVFVSQEIGDKAMSNIMAAQHPSSSLDVHGLMFPDYVLGDPRLSNERCVQVHIGGRNATFGSIWTVNSGRQQVLLGGHNQPDEVFAAFGNFLLRYVFCAVAFLTGPTTQEAMDRTTSLLRGVRDYGIVIRGRERPPPEDLMGSEKPVFWLSGGAEVMLVTFNACIVG